MRQDFPAFCQLRRTRYPGSKANPAAPRSTLGDPQSTSRSGVIFE